MAEAAKYFPSDKYSLMGTIFFLRFFCLAILSPGYFEKIDRMLRKKYKKKKGGLKRH
jgi:hypothetical protein